MSRVFRQGPSLQLTGTWPTSESLGIDLQDCEDRGRATSVFFLQAGMSDYLESTWLKQKGRADISPRLDMGGREDVRLWGNLCVRESKKSSKKSFRFWSRNIKAQKPKISQHIFGLPYSHEASDIYRVTRGVSQTFLPTCGICQAVTTLRITLLAVS